MTEGEFDRILDELHGSGKGPSKAPAADGAVGASSDDIFEDEFEALLDELHGNEGPGKVVNTTSATPSPASGDDRQWTVSLKICSTSFTAKDKAHPSPEQAPEAKFGGGIGSGKSADPPLRWVKLLGSP